MKTRYLLLCLALPRLVGAQSAPVVANGAFFAVSVADMNASVRWYTDKLGLKVKSAIPKRDKVAVTILEGDGIIVELLANDDARPVKDPFLRQGPVKVGVIVSDFDGVLSRLRSRGADIVLGPFPARDGQRANVIVKDNSGNLIQFFGK
jgi:catechol 2,3-dioxygenase-like lactoylglutathione lyase family enzyme